MWGHYNIGSKMNDYLIREVTCIAEGLDATKHSPKQTYPKLKQHMQVADAGCVNIVLSVVSGCD